MTGVIFFPFPPPLLPREERRWFLNPLQSVANMVVSSDTLPATSFPILHSETSTERHLYIFFFFLKITNHLIAPPNQSKGHLKMFSVEEWL